MKAAPSAGAPNQSSLSPLSQISLNHWAVFKPALSHAFDAVLRSQCFPRHRHQEFLRFLRRLDTEFPEKLKLHLILDNYGTHKHPKVESWLQRHPRFTLHFIPTSSSWLNQVERWFGELTQKAIRRGAFVSVGELQKVIEEFLSAWNEAPRPFVWTATVANIMEKVERARQKLEEIKPGWSQRKKRKTRR